MKEIWKKIKDNPKCEISNLGRVRSLYKYDVKNRIDIELIELDEKIRANREFD